MRTPALEPVRFSCGPDERIGATSLRGSNGHCFRYVTTTIEVHPRSDLAFTVREAVAVPCEAP